MSRFVELDPGDMSLPSSFQYGVKDRILVNEWLKTNKWEVIIGGSKHGYRPENRRFTSCSKIENMEIGLI